MRKSTLFVSALLTVFLMATMFGVVSAYQQASNLGVSFGAKQPKFIASQSLDPVSIPSPMPVVVEAPAVIDIQQPLVVSPEEATTVAVNFLNDPNVYSVEVVDYQGAPTYLVTFTSGDLIYVSSTGQVVASEKIQPVIVSAPPAAVNNNGSQANSGSNNNGGGGEREDHDDHDDHDHDDHDDDD